MENKREDKIEFEPFPGKRKKQKHLKKIILFIVIVIILVALYVSSSIFNKIVLYGNVSADYKKVNDFKSNYAYVSKENREDILKKIGFTSVMSRKKQLKDRVYDATYAYNKIEEYDGKLDEITIIYDDENKVKFVELNLIYLKNDFSISQVAADCNAVLKNYVNVTTPKTAIAEAKNDGFYYYNDSKSNIKVSYLLANTDKKYYTLKVIVGL